MPRQDLIQRYEEAYKRYENRIKSWTKKFHAVVKQIPKVKYTKNISEKSIERLEKQKWSQYSERKKKEARKEYEIQYENRVPTVYKPKPSYTPPTEQDFYNNITLEELEHERQFVDDNWYEEPDEDGYTETVDSRAEIEEWITRYIDPIDLDLIGTNFVEKDGVRDTIERLILEAADAYGDYSAYYSYLEEKAGVIVDLATKALMAYIGYKGWTYDSFPEAMPELATVLNLGRPLTKDQSERLQDEGWVSYDFND